MHGEPDGDDAAFLLQGISWVSITRLSQSTCRPGGRSSQIGYPMHNAAYLSIA